MIRSKVIGFVSLSMLVLAVSCGTSENKKKVFELDEQLTKIDTLERKTAFDKPFNKALTEDLITAYNQFADSFPQHDKTPDFLMNLSIKYYSLRKFHEQAQVYKRMIENYPGYSRIDEAYYMLAHILDSEFNNRTEARKYYQEHLERYPKSGFASDSEARLKSIDSLTWAQFVEVTISQNKKNQGVNQ
jgi:TolA-binding protein